MKPVKITLEILEQHTTKTAAYKSGMAMRRAGTQVFMTSEADGVKYHGIESGKIKPNHWAIFRIVTVS